MALDCRVRVPQQDTRDKAADVCHTPTDTQTHTLAPGFSTTSQRTKERLEQRTLGDSCCFIDSVPGCKHTVVQYFKGRSHLRKTQRHWLMIGQPESEKTNIFLANAKTPDNSPLPSQPDKILIISFVIVMAATVKSPRGRK